MQGPYTQSYEPLGNLYLTFEHGDVARSGYRRQLDLESAVAAVAAGRRVTTAELAAPVRESGRLLLTQRRMTVAPDAGSTGIAATAPGEYAGGAIGGCW